ncbi:MAG TPA: cell division protein ZipA [Gammaproteobacteria bacterium]|nr:cell division protein ZipA [Gammaproteobacteria bacterium]
MELRLILILIGAVIIAAVYLFSRQPKPRDKSERRSAPTFDELDFPDEDKPAADAKPRPVPVREQGDELILALHVQPRDGIPLPGPVVRAVMEEAGLRYGRYQVFHRLEGAGENASSVFSVANMVEPGSFDLKTLAEITLPGLTLFMVLPGPRGGVDAYADMLATARRLAQQLEAEVLDETRSTLTRQTARHIRERIIQFEHQRGLRRPS